MFSCSNVVLPNNLIFIYGKAGNYKSSIGVSLLNSTDKKACYINLDNNNHFKINDNIKVFNEVSDIDFIKKCISDYSIILIDYIELLEINKNERVVIIGPSGSGKSTLLRCMNLITKPTSGSITFEGVELTHKNITKYRQKMGMVFQNYSLFNNLNVIDNIILAPVKLGKYSRNDAVKKAQVLLKKFGLIDKINELPKNLSGGQRQRIAIIRSLLMEPDIMLFDEPTSALDPEMVVEVQDIMNELAMEGMTMVVVSHEVSFISKFATRIIYLEDGKIIEDGTFEDLRKSDNEKIKAFISKIS